MAIDFHAVNPGHEDVHRRLEEWGRWCHSPSPGKVSPMFRSVKPSQQWEAAEPRDTLDPIAAQQVERIVSGLPDNRSKALRWCYVWKWSPGKACRLLGFSLGSLDESLTDGRESVKTAIAIAGKTR
jgi:DNA-directed RNA polymerase specialized sigma24 family protein